MIKIEVQRTRAVIRHQEPLTVGLRGAKAYFTFGQDWDGLIKTAVFRQGEKTVAVSAIGRRVTIPWEVLTVPGVPVQIGVYGTDSTGEIAIPTVWTVTQPVRPGTDPAGDPSAEPTLGLWEQMQGKLGSLEEEFKGALQPVLTVSVHGNADGRYEADGDFNTVQQAVDEQRLVSCYWYDQDTMLNLADFQRDVAYTFTAITGAKEYRVVFPKNGDIACTVIRLAQDTQIPSKTSQLENDSGFLTEVPAVTVTALKVTVSQNQEGGCSVDCDPDVIEEALDGNRTVICYWYDQDIMLYPFTYRRGGPYIFTALNGGKEYRVVIRDTEDIDCAVANLTQEGGGNVFEITETLDKDYKEFPFELPVNWGRIKIANIHINFGKIETAFQLYGKLGGATQSLRDVTTGSEVGVNMFFVKAFETASQVSFGAGFTIGTASHGSARPALPGTGSAKAGRNSNALAFYSSTDGVLLPEGTTIQVWGVYE